MPDLDAPESFRRENPSEWQDQSRLHPFPSVFVAWKKENKLVPVHFTPDEISDDELWRIKQ